MRFKLNRGNEEVSSLCEDGESKRGDLLLEVAFTEG